MASRSGLLSDLHRDAQVRALFAFAALTAGAAITAVTVAGAFFTGFTVLVAWRLAMGFRRRRVTNHWSRCVVCLRETQLGLHIGFATCVACLAIGAGATSIATTAAIAALTAAFTTTLAGLAFAVGGSVV